MSYTRIFDLMDYSISKFNKDDVFANKINGEWRKYNAQETISLINNVSLGLLKLGVQKGDKIAIISANRPEWNFIDFGIQQAGAISVPLYPNITIADYKYIFNEIGVKFIFVSTKEILEKVTEASQDMSEISGIYSFDKLANAQHWSEVPELGKNEDVSLLKPIKDSIKPNDLLTIIYTSGTTGHPKGVMLSHNNIVSNTKGVRDAKYFQVDENDKALSFLPLCHIFERMVVYYYLLKGTSVYYAESMETIGDNLKEIRPSMFSTVPRLLEKVYDKIVAKGYEQKGIKKKLFFWALNLGLAYEPNISGGLWYNFQLAIARKLIFSKWKMALGGNLKLIASGSAALQPRLSRVFWAAGIPITEGYGLTETSPVIAACRVDPPDLRIGCVGTLMPDVQVKICEDGEIAVKGPNVMLGYFNKPEATAEVIDSEGWFHTGDIGTFVEDKFLKITDRKKEIFKTSGGKYIAPQLLENKLKESVLIEQAIVVGDGKKFPSALIIPEFVALKEWCLKNEIPCTNNQEMIKNKQVLSKLNDDVKKLMQSVANYEQVKKVAVLPNLFTIDAGELTPTLKLKRKVIHEKYKAEIEGIYE